MTTDTKRRQVLDYILQTLGELQRDGEIDNGASLSPETSLIGRHAILDSRALVELLIAVEEYMDETLDSQFDWTSDRAMSARNSPFRTPMTLAEFAVAFAAGE